MIIQRLAVALRKQDWVTVVIETLIVVLGVFLGLQLGNWNDARADRAEEREIVLRLLAEAEESQSNIERVIGESEKQAEIALRLHDRFFETDVVPDKAVLSAELFSMGGYNDEGYILAALDQVMSSGRIRLIRSDDLLDAIAAYKDKSGTSKKAFENLGAMNLETLHIELNRIDARLTPDGIDLVTPPEDILADEILRRQVGKFAMVYNTIHQFHENTLTVNQAYLDALTAYADEKGWLE